MNEEPGHHTMLGVVRRLLLVTVLPPVLAIGAGTDVAGAAARLDDVVVMSSVDATTVHLRTSERVRYQADLIDGPARLVVDLPETFFAWRPGKLDAAGPVLRQIRGSQFRENLARVVIELRRPASYSITEDPRGLVVTIANAAAEKRSALISATTVTPVLIAQTELGGPRPGDVAAPRPAAGLVTPVGLTAPAPILVAQAPPRPPSPTGVTPVNGRLISLDFKDADVVNLLRILAAESGKNLVISDDVKGKMSITLKNVPWDQVLEIILEARNLALVEKGNVMRIITREQLAREREAQAKLEEARLKAEEAKARASAEIEQKQAEADRKKEEARQLRIAIDAARLELEARGPIVEETIRLAYADPVDVEQTLRGLLGIVEGAGATPQTVIVPPAGPPFSALYGPQVAPAPPPPPPADIATRGITIKAHKPTNSLFIRHYAKDLERIKRLVRETLDVQLPQIKIEARLNELARTDLFDIGLQWGGGIAGLQGRNIVLASGNATPRIVDGLTGSLGTPVDPGAGITGRSSVNPGPTLSSFLPISGASGLPLGGNLVNLPLALGAPTFGIGFGIIGTRFNLNLALQALEVQGKTRSLSKPEIVTVENAKASIALGSEIPFATVSSAGTSVAFKEAALRLEVTPTVIRELDVTKIKMKVIVEDNSQSGTVPSGAAGGELPVISKRRAETEVVVREGASLVIGGITQRTETETVQKVPLLGDIPIVGWAFKRRSRAITPDRELIVFITPTVLRDPPRGTGPTSPPAR